MVGRFALFAAVTAMGCVAVPAQSLTGAGSTFAAPLYQAWASQEGKLHPGLQVNYQSIGSGGGIQQLSNGMVDFGGTDVPMTDSQMNQCECEA